MEKTKIIIGVLLLALVLVGGYIVMSEFVIPKYYSIGYNDAVVELIFKINQEGVVPVLFQNENQTSAQWFSIAEVCGV